MIEILTENLAAGELKTFMVQGEYLEILEAQYPLDVFMMDRSGGQISTMRQAEASFFSRPGKFEVFQVQSANAQRVRLFVGSGDAGTRRTAGVVQVIDGEKSRTIANMVFSGSPVFLASAGLYSNCQLFNPAGSGKNIVLKALGFSANAAGPVNVHLTATQLATDQTLDRAFSKLAGAGKGVGLVLSEGKAALVGPTMWGAQLEANVYLHWNVTGVVVLPPGTGITVQAGMLQATLQTNFEWFEETI